MHINHFETSGEARLNQILSTLKNIHGISMNVDLSAPLAESSLMECRSEWETKRDKIVSESKFNSYQQNPEYIKSMLILEAVRIMLTELAPKRRRRKIAESTETSMEEKMSPDLNDDIQLGRAMMQWSQDQRATDDASLRKMNAFSRVGEKLVNSGSAFPSPLTSNEKKVKQYAKAMFANQQNINENPDGKIPMNDLFHELGRAMMDYSQNPGIDPKVLGGKDEKVLADLNSFSKVGDKLTSLKTSFGPAGITKSDLQVIIKAMPLVSSKINLDPENLQRLSKIVSNTASKAGVAMTEAGADQDKDGDKDFADVQVARMVASGMPRSVAIAKTKGKDYNKEGMDGQLMEEVDAAPSAPSAPSNNGTNAVGRAHHYEYQASMARSELYRNSKYAMSMLKQIDPQSEVQPWIAGALTKSANLLDKVYHYLDYYKKFEPEKIPEGEDDGALGETSGGVSRQNLMLIMEYSIKLFEMIKPGDKLEGWVAMKLTTASECISSCKHYMDYVQFEQHAMDDHFAEGQKAKKKEVSESAIRLNEQEDLAKATTILAAKDMSKEIQDIAEDIAKLSVEDLMPLVDIMRGQFGQEAANGFNASVKAALEELLSVATKTKETMDAATDTINKGGIPSETSDLENADVAAEEPPATDGSDISADLEDLGDETEEEPETGEAEPLGRAKKDEVAESISVGKKVNVTNPKATPRYEVVKVDGDKITVKDINGKEMTFSRDRIMRANPSLSESKKGKPDFLDVDGDGDKKEPMKKAAKEKKEKKINEAAEKVAKIKKKDGGTGWTVYIDDRGEHKTIGFKSSKEDAQKIADKTNAKLNKKLRESAPPGKKAEEFIKSNKDSFKDRYGDRWQENLYATAWKKFGPKHEGYETAGKSLAIAKAELAILESALAAHRKEFKARLSEGKVSDPLGMGYGLEGDAILDKMAAVNKKITNAKNLMRVAMQEGVIGMLKTIESINKAEALEQVKNTTPYGVIYTTKGGRKSKRMFESADARAYWIELRSDSIRDPKLIDPDTFEKAINRATRG